MSKYKVGDGVRIRKDLILDEHYGDMIFTPKMMKYLGKKTKVIEVSDIYGCIYKLDVDEGEFGWDEDMLEIIGETQDFDFIETIKHIVQEELNKPLDIKIKYHDPNMPKLEKIVKGNWIDCRVIEGGTFTRFGLNGSFEKRKLVWKTIGDKKVIEYKKGDFMMLCLGISLNQGEGYEINLVPRSSTFKNYHIIQTNHFGVGDDTFVGNGDIYHFPCYALEDGQIELYDRVCQMRINKAMPQINFMEVDDMQSDDREGFGSTGVK